MGYNGYNLVAELETMPFLISKSLIYHCGLMLYFSMGHFLGIPWLQLPPPPPPRRIQFVDIQIWFIPINARISVFRVKYISICNC